MENESSVAAGSTANVLKWLLSSSLIAAGVAIWGTLLGLLYRTGWLSAFGVSQDLFIPASGPELTYWGYVALLEMWVAVQQGLYDTVLKMAGILILGVVIGIAAALVSKKYGANLKKLGEKRTTMLSISMAVLLGAAMIYPVVIFVAATTVLALPLPAHSLGKKSGQSAIERYRSEVAEGKRPCHVLVGATGPIGTCPMVIAESSGRLAFLDGPRVYVIPSEGLQIHWPITMRPAGPTSK